MPRVATRPKQRKSRILSSPVAAQRKLNSTIGVPNYLLRSDQRKIKRSIIDKYGDGDFERARQVLKTKANRRLSERGESLGENLLEGGVVQTGIPFLGIEGSPKASAAARKVVLGTKNPSGLQAALSVPGIGGIASGARLAMRAIGAVRGAERAVDTGRAVVRASKPKVRPKKAPAKTEKQLLKEARKGATPSQVVAARLQARRSLSYKRRGPVRLAKRKPAKPRKQVKMPGTLKVASGTGTAGAFAASPVYLASAGGDKNVSRAVTAPAEIGRAFVEAPGKTTMSTARSLRDTLIGAPAAVYKVGEAGVALAKGDTAKAKALADEVIADYEHRYGPLLEGDAEEFRKRVQEGGLTPYAFDALVVAPPVGRVAGSAARTGGLGRGVQRFATKKRPELRVAPGRAVEQRTSKNLLGVVGQRTLDRTRKARMGEGRAGAVVGRRGDPLSKDARKKGGEVVPIRLNKTLKRRPGQLKGRALERMRPEQNREIFGGLLKDAHQNLSKVQRDMAAKYAITLGITTPDTARAVMDTRVKQIRGERMARAEADPDYKGPPDKWDEIPVLNALIAEADTIFTPALRQFADTARRRGKRAAGGDPAVRGEQAMLRIYAQQGETLGVQPIEGESPTDYVGRVRTAAKKAGLTDPGYFPSQVRRGPLRSAYTAGGTVAVKGDKTYTGSLFREGKEDPRINTLAQGLAKNIKRKFNWNLVADTYREMSFAWSREKTPAQLLEEMAERGIPENAVQFYNPRMFKTAVGNLLRADAEGVDVADVTSKAATRNDLQKALDASVVSRADLETMPEAFQKSSGFALVPTTSHNEIYASARGQGQGALGRSLDVGTQTSSRILLGAGNIPWLKFQVASNAILAGLAGGTGPTSIVKSIAWWRGLTRAEQEATAPLIGAGSSKMDSYKTKLGASADNFVINGWRALKETVGGKVIWSRSKNAKQVRDLNPIDALLALDNAQNNIFRRAVFYNQVKKDAYERMGGRMRAMADEQNGLNAMLGLGPKEKMRAILRDPEAMERHAQYTADFLGDYASFTTRERTLLKRNVMFYGFLRHSLRLTFYTMPVRHPVITGLGGNLARLQTEEVRELLGGDWLPFALGRIYSEDGDTKVDLTRANPFMNALSSAAGSLMGPSQEPTGALGMLPPMWGSLYTQVAEKDPFTGKPIKLAGESSARTLLPFTLPERGRVLLEDGLSLFYPYRVAEDVGNRGAPQGADTLLWNPRPTQYSKESEAYPSIQKTKRLQEGLSVGDIIGRELAPYLPQPNTDVEYARSVARQFREEEKSRMPSRSSSGSSWYGSGSSTSSGWYGSTSSRSSNWYGGN